MNPSTRAWWPLTVALSLLLLTGTPVSPTGEEEAFAKRHREFLEEVEMLINDGERAAFLELREDYQRDAFVERFWRARDPFPRTRRNELRDRWTKAAAEARQRYEDLSEDRARMLLANGPPQRTLRPRCGALRELEVWHYTNSPAVRGEFTLVFVRTGAVFRLWRPGDGFMLAQFSNAATDQELFELIAQECSSADLILRSLSLAVDWAEVEERIELFPDPGSEWAQSFLSYTTILPEDAETLAASMRVDFPGRHRARTVVQALIEVPRSEAAVRQTDDGDRHDFLVDGEVIRQGELFEHFRYRFGLPAKEGGLEEEGDGIPVVVQRYLRPGVYTLAVKLQDLNSDRFFRTSTRVEVPKVVRRGPVAVVNASRDLGPLEVLREANATVASAVESQLEGEHSVKIDAPSRGLVTGKIRISAQTTGEGIARVSFELNGNPVLAKSRPPYSVELDLGRAPRTHTLRVAALDPGGVEVASDEVLLNTGPHRFSVRLIEPQRGRRYARSVRAVAEVEVPELETLDRVEFYLNETLIASLFQPPFVQPILIPPGQSLSYVRALGILDGGASTEDVVFVNSPDLVDEIRINFVELYTTVLDSKGRPAEGLSAEDFRVFEEGREQEIRRFELVRDLPIHAGILLDLSTSMQDRLEEAEEAAMHFFQIVLTPQDRACLLTFNDEPQLAVRFTNSVEILAGGLAGLVAEGETALYDSLIYALYYFNGLKGKRAVILLSDGEDVASRYSFDEALEFARRTGVSIYSIGLSIPNRAVDIRSKLMRLCQETGGSCFFVESAAELKSVYTRIEQELRSQYLVAYQSSERPSGDKFRRVELKVERRGLKAKTMRGYYP